jgi:hypothetical protein
MGAGLSILQANWQGLARISHNQDVDVVDLTDDPGDEGSPHDLVDARTSRLAHDDEGRALLPSEPEDLVAQGVGAQLLGLAAELSGELEEADPPSWPGVRT